ncbi:hypothetical protein M5689_007916 [Euphorbia peplus]|nr:hypothetical protein M5689_007916 [Euphorbia peplus]
MVVKDVVYWPIIFAMACWKLWRWGNLAVFESTDRIPHSPSPAVLIEVESFEQGWKDLTASLNTNSEVDKFLSWKRLFLLITISNSIQMVHVLR